MIKLSFYYTIEHPTPALVTAVRLLIFWVPKRVYKKFVKERNFPLRVLTWFGGHAMIITKLFIGSAKWIIRTYFAIIFLLSAIMITFSIIRIKKQAV
jgi:hypothetical protein